MNPQNQARNNQTYIWRLEVIKNSCELDSKEPGKGGSRRGPGIGDSIPRIVTALAALSPLRNYPLALHT